MRVTLSSVPLHRCARLGSLLAIVLAVSSASPVCAEPAAPREGLLDDIAAAEGFVKAAEQDHETTPAELVRQRLRLLRLYREAQSAKKMNALGKKLVEGFGKAGLPKDGGPVAEMAAEAQFWLLEPRALEVLQRKAPVLAVKKAEAQLAAQIKVWTLDVTGDAVAVAGEGLEGRKGGLCGALHGEVGSYLSRQWQVASAWMQARLIGHFAALVEGMAAPAASKPEEAAAVRKLAASQAAVWRSDAERLLRAAWAAIDRHGIDTVYKVEVLRELNRYQPAQFPLSRVRGERWLDKASEGAATALRQAGVLDDLRACYDRHLARTPDDLIGEFTVTLQVEQGRLTVQEATHADPAAVMCVRERLQGPRTGLPDGPLQVRLRLEFAAL